MKSKAPADIAALAREHGEAAIRKIVAIMERPDGQEAVQLRAAQALLDRGWGKARSATGEMVLVPPIGRVEWVIVDHRSHDKAGDQAERTWPDEAPQN